ncbi:MAG: glycosyltransferase family 2 protein [Acidobacteriota bacterium]|nr:glycosyltransferase family 2 protein [Acidobacteriota bacterium]
MPRVDIIIPAYNAAKYLPTAIESVVSQTFEDWRILLVDDGSTDNTVEVVAPYIESLGARIKYVKQSNRGLPAARNMAIRHSSAEFLALLDADDVWLPSRLYESMRCFEDRPQVGLAYGRISRIDQAGRLLDTWGGNNAWAAGKIARYIYMLKVQLPCPTMTFRRKCVEEVGGFDETMRATEDRDLWFRIAERYDVACSSQVLAHYRTSPGSMSSDPDRMLQAQLKFVRKHYGRPGCGFWARSSALGCVYRQHAEALSARKQRLPAFVSSIRAVTLSPWDLSNAKTAASILLTSR